jgi:hypothetical protein
MTTLAERLRKLDLTSAEDSRGVPVSVPWPELCAVVEAAENLCPRAQGVFERETAETRAYAALEALARRLDEEGL